MAHRVLTRPINADEVPGYQRALRIALEELGVDCGEQFVVISKAEIVGTQKIARHDEEASGGTHSGDPETSRKGAEDVKVRAGTHRHLVLQDLADQGAAGAISDEIMTRIPQLDLYGVRRRLSELAQAGFAEGTGRSRPGSRGSEVEIYVITAAGIQSLGEANQEALVA